MTTAIVAPTVSGAPHSSGPLTNIKWLAPTP